MSGAPQDIVIVGAGLAGVRTAQRLRDLGYDGRLRLYSEESEHPYDRPPLSKGFLIGERDIDAIRLAEPSEYEAQGIELMLAKRAVALDIWSDALHLSDGSVARYDRLVIATGARPRRLELIADSPAVHYLRTVDDARRLATALNPGAHVAIIGGGFIGLEVAAAAQARGCAATIVEIASLPLANVIAAMPAHWLQSWHTARGVNFRCGATVTASSAHKSGIRLDLDDGSEVIADAVVVGVGIVRDTQWLAAAGLDVHHGLICDRSGRTSHPHVFGAGDVVCQHDGTACSPIAHWTAATDSATRVAEALAGKDAAGPEGDGFFWSDQGKLRLQFAGYAGPQAEINLVAGAPDEDSFVVHYSTDGGLTGVFAANRPRDFLRGRMALRQARTSSTQPSGA
jgi:3-phenylpropionate/trans-cinnamate dioxygenase ferredoxin reductase component